MGRVRTEIFLPRTRQNFSFTFERCGHEYSAPSSPWTTPRGNRTPKACRKFRAKRPPTASISAKTLTTLAALDAAFPYGHHRANIGYRACRAFPRTGALALLPRATNVWLTEKGKTSRCRRFFASRVSANRRGYRLRKTPVPLRSLSPPSRHSGNRGKIICERFDLVRSSRFRSHPIRNRFHSRRAPRFP